ncbi:MAG: fibronectin type III domain-containing protein [Terracidiphilus sp.]|nr:fibronectin type III domain-containing protein [Terracidiphilus sp.]
MRGIRGWAVAGAVLAGVVAGVTGCGTPGAPQPPSLNLPERVTDLEARRTGTRVELDWTMPRRNTDKLLLKSTVTVRVCREDGASGCVDAGVLEGVPGARATWAEELPAAEAKGDARALKYFVELKNANGRSAGLSNAAGVVAGEAPLAVDGLKAEVWKTGVAVRWQADGEQAMVRLRRTLLTPKPAKEKDSLLAAPTEPTEMTLRVEDVDEGRALDKTARFGETYEYRAQRVALVTLDGKELELPGSLSGPVRVDVKDVFPPDAPAGLAAVAVTGEGAAAIDLSWLPNTEDDLAGYVVYRREGDGAWMRVSPAALLTGPAYHDATVEAGKTYYYAVTAVDQGGHESGRSAEAAETVPDAGDAQ